jgi:tRNA A-37 threonylcarbamoyl transferase component Bud32
VMRPLGLGGMAHVLLCEDERLGRLVAVKRLHADSADVVERRFLREAKLGAALNHPNLVSVFDTAVDDEGVLIVMEYVDGEPLSRALRGGSLSAPRVVRIARELGAALDHAHANGVVHRDVKPGNVLLRSDGVTKLADLGIATAVDLTRITRSGEVLGTAAYMAPEQLEGGESGPSTDVYALAAVCYEALTGERARRGRNALEIAHRVATEDPPDLREHLPSAPVDAAETLKSGMARNPSDRPASAGELASRLGAALEAAGAEGSPFGAERPARTRVTPRRPRTALPAPAASGPFVAGAPALASSAGSASPSAPRPARGARGGRWPALAAVAALLLIAGVVAAVVVSSGDGDGGPATPRAAERGQQQARQDAPARGERAGRRREPRAETAPPQSAQPAPDQPATRPDQPAEGAPAPAAGSASGAQLNDRGYALMQAGDYANAIAPLEQAVRSWPADSRDLTYAYALFNLGKSLNRAGRPDEAIPYLTKRLSWDDQRDTVQAELDLARRSAARG